jgi:hypothetical protein
MQARVRAKKDKNADNEKDYAPIAELLTPVALQRLLLQKFEEYLNGRKPEFLKDHSDSPAVGGQEQQEQRPKDEATSPPSSLFGSTVSYFKKKATQVYEHAARTHATIIEFMREEMEDILRQQGSSLKKMTDLSILFYGLCSYISTRNSVDLHNALGEIEQRLWAGVPFVSKYDVVSTQVKRFIEENRRQTNSLNLLHSRQPNISNIDDPTIVFAYTNFLAQQLETSKSHLDPSGVHADRLQFLFMFAGQIIRAHQLISLNSTLLSKAYASKCKPNCPLYTERDILTSLAWRYRCLDSDNMVSWKWEPLKKSFWSKDTCERVDQWAKEKLKALSPPTVEGTNAPVVILDAVKSPLVLIDYVNALIPAPCMGNTYGKFLTKVPESEYTLAYRANNNNAL